MSESSRPQPLPPPDMREQGAPVESKAQFLDRRLYVQLLAFTDVPDPQEIVNRLALTEIEAVVYANISDPKGVGIAFLAEDPATFIEPLREFMREALSKVTPVPELTMIGRTYGTGREPELEDWLLHRPRQRITDPTRPWAVWYPLRRRPEFYRFDHRERGGMMAEHGMLGRSYGDAGLAQDIRLKCFGLDRNDNEFLIGLVGADLNPLSRLVEDMRGTRQTAEYMDNLGPFFVGHRIGTANVVNAW